MNKCTRALAHTCEIFTSRVRPRHLVSGPDPRGEFAARAFPRGLLCQHVIDLRHSPFPFVDIAKLRTKKMRSNLLKRIQKLNSESPSKNRNYWYQTFCKSETKSETSSGIPLKRSPGLMHRSPSIYPHEDAYRGDC